MRAPKLARWVSCALAITVCLPAVATARKSLSDCTTFEQTDKGEDAVELKVANSCSIPVDCTVQWKVICAPDSKKRRAVHADTAKISIKENGAATKDVSAAVCGDDAFSIEGITWTCAPNNE